MQAMTASRELLFILLEEFNLDKRQDLVSLDKLHEMLMDYCNKILERTINTRTMDVRTPKELETS